MAERKRKLASIVAPNDDALNEFQVNNKSQKLLAAEPSNSNILPHQASKVRSILRPSFICLSCIGGV